MASSAEGTHRHPSKRLCTAQRDPGRDPRRDGAEGSTSRGSPWAPEKGPPVQTRSPAGAHLCAVPCEAGAVTLEPTPAQPVATAPTLAFHRCRRPRPLPYTSPPPGFSSNHRASSATPPRPLRVGAGLLAGTAFSASPLLGSPAPRKFSENDGSGLCVRTGLCPKTPCLPLPQGQPDPWPRCPTCTPHGEQPGPPQVCPWPSLWGRASFQSLDSLQLITPGLEQDAYGPYYDKATRAVASGQWLVSDSRGENHIVPQ